MSNQSNSRDVTKEELMEKEGSSERTAQNDLAKMRKRARKERLMPVPFEDYCDCRGYNRAQGLRALEREPDAVPPAAA